MIWKSLVVDRAFLLKRATLFFHGAGSFLLKSKELCFERSERIFHKKSAILWKRTAGKSGLPS